MSLQVFLLLAGGMGLLVAGAEGLVRGASGLARRVGISPLVVGLTVVAFGTSAPEAAVSVQAVLADRGGLAVGNVVGSNIFNVLFILGISALVAPLVGKRRLVRFDVPVMVAVSALPLALGLDGRIVPLEGGLLLAGGVAFTVFLVMRDRRAEGETTGTPAGSGPESPDGAGAASTARPPSVVVALLALVVGLVLLVLGARWLVDGASELGRALGASELVVGLTVVAGGTSLPEAATSVVATFRGERDMAVGNVVGSNIFNVLFVLGLAAAVGGLPISPGALSFDLPIMFAVAVACLPVFFTGYVISRWEGAVFLTYYAAYLVFLVLDAAAHEAEPVFTGLMLGFVLPITAFTLVVIVVREVRGDLRGPDRGAGSGTEPPE